MREHGQQAGVIREGLTRPPHAQQRLRAAETTSCPPACCSCGEHAFTLDSEHGVDAHTLLPPHLWSDLSLCSLKVSTFLATSANSPLALSSSCCACSAPLAALLCCSCEPGAQALGVHATRNPRKNTASSRLKKTYLDLVSFSLFVCSKPLLRPALGHQVVDDEVVGCQEAFRHSLQRGRPGQYLLWGPPRPLPLRPPPCQPARIPAVMVQPRRRRPPAAGALWTAQTCGGALASSSAQCPLPTQACGLPASQHCPAPQSGGLLLWPTTPRCARVFCCALPRTAGRVMTGEVGCVARLPHLQTLSCTEAWRSDIEGVLRISPGQGEGLGDSLVLGAAGALCGGSCSGVLKTSAVCPGLAGSASPSAPSLGQGCMSASAAG